MKLDPTGRLDGDFYDEFDNLIGSDGIDDGKVYVINTSETEFENGNDVIKGKGQSLEVSNEAMNFVSNNNGDSCGSNSSSDTISISSTNGNRRNNKNSTSRVSGSSTTCITTRENSN